ncbi:MAG: hypothetical protein JWM04_2593 [Verrucomicrobiales bacterium]|nr:hypothetical protein [Verrucomicrobiales bacterium]
MMQKRLSVQKKAFTGGSVQLSRLEPFMLSLRYGPVQRRMKTNHMKMIQPNCRIQFNASDIDFITIVLAQEGQSATIRALLSDDSCRDSILDDRRLYDAILEQRGCLSISSHLYFYVLVRHSLLRMGVQDRPVADYVAELLSEFSRTEQSRCCIPGQAQPLEYFFEMLGALQTSNDYQCFCLRTYMANLALFTSGLFKERIEARAERRGFPGLRYYQDMGRMNYRVASHHRLARKFELGSVLETLSEKFEPTRCALNDLSERILFLNDPQVSGWQAFLN